MRTPAGNECRYFYGDYYRGRQNEECRLLNSANPPLSWSSELCVTCPVPRILLANACQYMELHPRVERLIPLIGKRQVKVRTFCSRSQRVDFDAYIGCGECHPLPPLFLGEES